MLNDLIFFISFFEFVFSDELPIIEIIKNLGNSPCILLKNTNFSYKIYIFKNTCIFIHILNKLN
jgi:hypothetical protein